jgi:hypothetical protein
VFSRDHGEKNGKVINPCLTLTHIIPPLPSNILHNVFLGDEKMIYRGKFDIGCDGMLISMPANSKSIKTKYLFG